MHTYRGILTYTYTYISAIQLHLPLFLTIVSFELISNHYGSPQTVPRAFTATVDEGYCQGYWSKWQRDSTVCFLSAHRMNNNLLSDTCDKRTLNMLQWKLKTNLLWKFQRDRTIFSAAVVAIVFSVFLAPHRTLGAVCINSTLKPSPAVVIHIQNGSSEFPSYSSK